VGVHELEGVRVARGGDGDSSRPMSHLPPNLSALTSPEAGLPTHPVSGALLIRAMLGLMLRREVACAFGEKRCFGDGSLADCRRERGAEPPPRPRQAR